MSDWFYLTGAVLIHPETDEWWHVIGRMRDVDTGTRFYRLADATHTEYKERLHADWVEDWDSAGWRTNTKPAAERGYRVNGRLVGPKDIHRARGNACIHNQRCPNCGGDGNAEIDVIVDHAENRVYCECLSCNEMWEGDSDE